MSNSIFSFTIEMSPILQEINKMSTGHTEQFVNAVLKDAQTILLNYIKNLAPRKTGGYAASWSRGSINGHTAKLTTSNPDLFLILEYTGSKAHLIFSKKGKAIPFHDSAGNLIFRMWTYPKGFAAIPHVQPATRRLEQNFQTILAANMDKYSKMFASRAKEVKPKVEKMKTERLINNTKKN